jgi:LysM repeat protein
MLNKIIYLCVMSLAVSAAHAQDVEIKPDHPDSYVVVKGDTLWSIAGRFLQEPWRWPEIWKANPKIADPNLIYPGDVVTLRYEDGSPILTVDRGGAGSVSGTSRSVKLSPRVREYSREGAVPTIPIDVIRHLLLRPLVVGASEMETWPYVVSGNDGHLVAGKNDKVYVRGQFGDAGAGNYSIYRKGQAYVSEGKILGYEALHVADTILMESGDPATFQITQSNREVLVGDRLLAQSEKDINSDFIPQSPAGNILGSIISAIDGVSEIGQYQVVVLDRGESDGLAAGHVLGIYQSGEIVSDKSVNEKASGLNNTALIKYLGQFKTAKEQVELPDDLTGVLMVFRTYDNVSYGLVMEAYGAIHVDDTVKNL